MPVVAFRDILDPAFEERYGVAAFNVVDDVSLRAVIDAASELDSPLIVQTSLKTVKSIGAKVLYEMFRAMAEDAPVPITLHLDHCPDREWATICLKTGWNSVLFDGSHLDIEENTRQTAEVVEEAREYGADVEGEIESVLRGRERSRVRRNAQGRQPVAPYVLPISVKHFYAREFAGEVDLFSGGVSCESCSSAARWSRRPLADEAGSFFKPSV